jgi:hypothetical protein
MSEATEKQISFATSLGIENPSQYSKEALKELISSKAGSKGNESSYTKKTQPQPSNGQIGTTEGIAQVIHSFESEYEFGPAGNRHKIKYRTIEELKERMKQLEDAGYLIEHEKF